MGWAAIAPWKMVISETAQQVNISYAEEKGEKTLSQALIKNMFFSEKTFGILRYHLGFCLPPSTFA